MTPEQQNDLDVLAMIQSRMHFPRTTAVILGENVRHKSLTSRTWRPGPFQKIARKVLNARYDLIIGDVTIREALSVLWSNQK